MNECETLRWRDPKTDPPTSTGVILVLLMDYRPALVDVNEAWMSYTDGVDETDPADPDEWVLWSEIPQGPMMAEMHVSMSQTEKVTLRFIMPLCVTCGRPKKPVGRDSMDNGLCQWDCDGYLHEPLPGTGWPSEQYSEQLKEETDE